MDQAVDAQRRRRSGEHRSEDALLPGTAEIDLGVTIVDPERAEDVDAHMTIAFADIISRRAGTPDRRLDRFWIAIGDDAAEGKETVMTRETQIRVSVGVFITVLAALGCAGCGGATEHELETAMTGEVHWEVTDQCQVVTTMTDGVGEDPELGPVTTAWAHCPEDDVVGDGRVTIVDENGDELYGTYDYPEIDNGAPITFDGGTGRFENATGTATVAYDVELTFREDCDPDTDPFMCLTNSPWSATVTGTVKY
jgi:hypothetical protein